MHENNIELLCHEAERLLELNIDLLQKMLTEPKVLGDSNAQLFDRSKAEKRIEELQGEQKKILGKEMVLAVVGTMKAGKSTTINAIVGKEILPNRNRPMTSIPTLIRHVPRKIIPELRLDNIEPIQKLFVTLQKKIDTEDGKKLLTELKKDQALWKLLDIIADNTWLKGNYYGEEDIFSCLASLNDLVRLATALRVDFPFSAYEEVHKLPVIEVEFSHLVGMDDSQGTLTLLDTPGPNEAGQPQLQAMMRDQLQKASAVLAVLDYTQLKSEADQQVRKELNAIAEVAAGRLFVLVNKFDQKNANSDNAETVKQAIPAMLDSGALNSDRVYPGSSLRAYLANRARSVVDQAGKLSVSEEWVDDFAKMAFGLDWREEEDDVLADVGIVLKKANTIWRTSLFEKLITEVIHAAHAKAAALAVDSAAAKLVQNAENIDEYLSLRHQGLQASIQTLQTQIKDLLSDIDNIDNYQKQVDSEVKSSMGRITHQTGELLSSSEKILNEQLDEYFKDGKRKEQDAFNMQAQQQGRGFWNLMSTVAGNTPSGDRDFDPNNSEVKFSEHAEAVQFIERIEESVTSLLAETEKKIKPTLTDIVSTIEKNFHGTTMQAVDKIASQINSRLEDDGFTVKISFPKVSQLQTNLAIGTRMTNLLEEKTFSETRQRRSSGAWGTVCKWFNTDNWGWETYSVDVTRSVVDIRKIKIAVTNQTRAHFKELNNMISKKINEPILQEINTFFISFKGKVEQLRNTLIQSTEDHKSSKQDQEQLTERLSALRKLTPEMISDSKILKKELEPML
ncbi:MULTISPECIES: dynamin family protein [Aeromonas]|uniref:dynamin family protein n=1 Tax=Aeromonas TaxID=642 RepID=UPI0034A19DD9